MNLLGYARPLAAIVLLALGGFGLWALYHAGVQTGRNEVQLQWDADKIRRDQAQQKALADYAKNLQQAEVRHDKDRAVIDNLHDELGRMRVHLPTAPTGSGHDENLSSGTFSGGVDQSFGRLQERAGQLFRECDTLNADARRMKMTLGNGAHGEN